jgi:hypothetical protein
MRRRNLILVILVIVIALAGAGLFLILRSQAPGLVVDTGLFGSAGDREPGLAPVTDAGVPVPGAGEAVAPRLLKLADGPVAKGVIALYTPPATTQTASSTNASSTEVVTTPEEVEVRYIDRQSGNVYSFRVHERVATRLSNKTLPGIQEAAWLSDGSRAFVRFLEKDGAGGEHVSTYMLPANGEGGYFLEQDLAEVRTASSSVLALYSSGSGSVASLAGPDGTSGKTLFSSALSALTLRFAGASVIAATKPTSALDGYAFLVNPAGSFTRLLGPLRGLTVLPSPSGSQALYSYVDRTRLYTQVLDVANRTSVSLPLVTLAEKCAWNREGTAVFCGVPTAVSGNLPDAWYQGAHAFSDRIWRIDLASRVATLVLDPREVTGQPMDIEALALDSASDVLVFMNRLDGSLWSYDL